MAEISDICSDCIRVKMTEKQKKEVAKVLKYFTGQDYAVRGKIITPPSDCENAITLTMQSQKITRTTPEKGRDVKTIETYENTILAEKRYCIYLTGLSVLGEEK